MLSLESSGGSRILKRGFKYVIKVHVARLLKGSGACPARYLGFLTELFPVTTSKWLQK